MIIVKQLCTENSFNIKNYGQEVETEKTRENREDRRLGLGRGGVELFRPLGVIGHGPQRP